MNRSDDDKLIDKLIGEAVMTLLESEGPVNSRALTDELRRMAAQEQNLMRRESILRATREVKQSIDAYRHQTARDAAGQQNGPRSVFDHHSAGSGSRKH
ncbi:hypothetical protein BTJ39_05325 [Izhakiella australiensis]|uniref:Uncharacterized protein n=1 Tax=Izhakiella australiensis TaxID=1926881 RepID=A0A1S8YRW8_9GAMM|nr:hypothetical protein [Izhakiella australiensis]OON41383.1 hypothetical protein BTJ39_05325 [Izhakiella australiensis]